MSAKRIMIDQITVDQSIQPRCQIDERVVGEYAEAMEAGDVFPPLHVFLDADGHYILAGGFTRLAAHIRAGHEDVECIVHQGGLREALRFALADNAKNGQRYTLDDHRRMVGLVLADPEWCSLSTAAIARRIGISWHTVDKIRQVEQPVRPAVIKIERGDGTVEERRERDEFELVDEPTPKPPRAKKEVVRDATGSIVPDAVRDAFAAGETLKAQVAQIEALRNSLLGAARSWNPWLRVESIGSACESLLGAVRDGIPFRACVCKGGCRTCKQSGWLPEWKAGEV